MPRTGTRRRPIRAWTRPTGTAPTGRVAEGLAATGRPADPSSGPHRRPGGGSHRTAAGLGGPSGRSAAHRGRGGFGQDPGAHPADRPPDRLGRRRPLADPGHHLHQQGRRRDAQAGGRAGRPSGRRGCGCPPSTRRACASSGPTGTASATRDPSPSTTTPTRGGWSRSSAASWTSTPKSCRRGRSSARSARPSRQQLGPVEYRAAGGDHLRPSGGRRVRPVPAADGGGQRHGLRRPVAQHGQAVQGAPGRARALPDPFHPHPDRRVPGHQLGAERAGRAARRRAPQHRGGRGQRPVGLPVPGSGHQQHPRFRGGLPRCHRHHPGPELPLLPDHPRRRQRGHRQQRVPEAEDAVDRRRGRRARSSATGPRTSTTRRPGWPTR